MSKNSSVRTVQQLKRIKLTNDVSWNVGDVITINKIDENTITIKRIYNSHDKISIQ